MTRAQMSLPAFVDERANRLDDRVAVRCEAGRLTYAEVADLSARAAQLLAAAGVRRGDRVLTAVGNTLDLPVSLVAAARLGAILVPLNHEHRGEMLRYMVSQAAPSAVICDADRLDHRQREDVRVSAPDAAWFDRADFLAIARDHAPRTGDGRPDDAAAIFFTSGTTGRSKGAVLSQRFLLFEAESQIRVAGSGKDEVFWTALPLFHTNALCLTLLGAWLAEGRAVVRDRFSASRFWEQIRQDQATVANLLGAMVPILLKTHPDPVRDHRLRLAIGGGVPPAAVREFKQRFSVGFREVYGLTETGLNAVQTSADDVIGSVGKPLPNWDIRVDAGPGNDGEIQIRGREPGTLFDGYWQEPDRTGDAMTDDGFFRTGDLGRFDADGYLYFRGRIKECIRRRGENISPVEVEFSALQHPLISECVAVAVPSELAEDEVKLVYVLREDADLSPADLHAFCERQMAPYMVPRYLERRDSLPRTQTQKIERRQLTGLGSGVHDMDRREDKR